ncbi:unnamed protein product [Rhizopus stolonifer]
MQLLATENTPYEQGTKSKYSTPMSRIMSIETWSNQPFVKPKLKKDNVLSLLYHADEQWMASSKALQKDSTEQAVESVHLQQHIYLDTLYLLQKSLCNQYRRYAEPIYFSAQVLYHGCQVSHLEPFTDHLRPHASRLVSTLEQIRCTMYRLLERRQHELFFLAFLSQPKDNTAQELIPYLEQFLEHWDTFEQALLNAYMDTVFGSQHPSPMILHRPRKPLLHESFQDQFTQLLPLTLERAIDSGLLELAAVSSFEPLIFVALPRLTILAGVSWLNPMTEWRGQQGKLPFWIQSHVKCLENIIIGLGQLEQQLLTENVESHLDFVDQYRGLENALVSGNQHLDKD